MQRGAKEKAKARPLTCPGYGNPHRQCSLVVLSCSLSWAHQPRAWTGDPVISDPPSSVAVISFGVPGLFDWKQTVKGCACLSAL